MGYIQLTKGFVTLVDDDLLDELNSYLWYASGIDGRPARRLKEPPRKLIYMYHQILNVKPWELKLQGKCIDHINGDPLDNRRSNIRIVDIHENARNTNRHKLRQGIGYDAIHDRYKVYIDMPSSARTNIGTYKTLVEAKIALATALMEREIEDHPYA